MAVRACPVSTCDWSVDAEQDGAQDAVREHWEGHSELERRWAGPNPPPFQQTASCQYPCPGGCGVWVELSNAACLYCWTLANPLTRQEAKGLPADHPRRPRSTHARQP